MKAQPVHSQVWVPVASHAILGRVLLASVLVWVELSLVTDTCLYLVRLTCRGAYWNGVFFGLLSPVCVETLGSGGAKTNGCWLGTTHTGVGVSQSVPSLKCHNTQKTERPREWGRSVCVCVCVWHTVYFQRGLQPWLAVFVVYLH